MKIQDLRTFSSPLERFQATLELIDAGFEHYRQRMRRENPQASEEEIEALVQAWVLESPCESVPPGGRWHPSAFCKRCKRLLAERSPGVWSRAVHEDSELPADQCTPNTPHEPEGRP